MPIEADPDDFKHGTFDPAGELPQARERIEEFFCFNTEGCWVGEHTPAFFVKPPEA